ncbi:Chitinase, GH18 family [Mucilaginibacter pineti]|uniref:chitinase n=1 Tax=Mucilaginibacter pineti TaxID=1391627 RepID=A0A1G7LRR5_9SPHI|nr:glycosyl hydrolase family 18 protein [Mucilaginibacter pineti]SDF52207.1 Chitinase, GH18 family [Mucilaginibacter pineti]
MSIFKNKALLTLTFFVLMAIAGCKKSGVKAQENTNNSTNTTTPAKFRVVGYLRYEGNLVDEASAINMSMITHLNVAFINPDKDGNFAADDNLRKVAVMAHAKGVQILVSIAGGTPPAYISTLIAPGNQAKFIASLLKLTDDNSLDGIDVDLEQSFVDNNYQSFVTNLAAALKAKKKLTTAAIATVYADSYPDKALAQLDFINVMSYDKTGPWNQAKPGQHSPYSMAVDDIAYWSGTRGIAKEKLSVGVPFYGYGFGTNAPESLSFAEILLAYPGSENDDQVTVSGGGIMYYNGIPTIKSKTQLALNKAGGIMIWQLRQDATGANSLLGAINSVIKANTK